jgi:hypothetical protein
MELFPKSYKTAEDVAPGKRTLIVQNVRNISNDELAAIFDDYGRVFDCKVLLHPHREPSDEALVTMDENGAYRAQELLSGRTINGEKVSITVREKELKIKWVEKKYRQSNEAPGSKKEWKALAQAFDKKRNFSSNK